MQSERRSLCDPSAVSTRDFPCYSEDSARQTPDAQKERYDLETKHAAFGRLRTTGHVADILAPRSKVPFLLS